MAEGGRVMFVGPDPLPAVASGLPVICADSCGMGVGAGAAWERFQVSGVQSSASLLQQPAVRARVRSSVDAITVWKSSAAIERVALELGVRLANSPALIARRLENKSYFSRAAAAAGLPLPPTATGAAGPELLEAAARIPGPWVFQLAHGFSGQHTYPANSELELEALIQRFADRPSRVAELVAGTPVTVTGVVARERVMIGSACLQLTGLASLTPYPLGSCGNDYTTPVPAARAVRQLALEVGEWLQREGHLGIFGLDLVVDRDGRCWCIEVNSRLVASVPLFSLSARDRGGPGLLSQHLACFGIGEPAWADPQCHWSQVILYQQGERLARPGAATGRGLISAEGQFRPSGKLGLDGPGAGEAGLWVQGHSQPGRELARLWFEGPCATSEGHLLAWIDSCVADLRLRLEAPG